MPRAMRSLSLFLLSMGMLVLQGQCQDSTAPDDYTDDIFHCQDPQRVADIADTDLFTISCNLTTWKWNVDELDEASPPTLCLGIHSLETLQEPISDWLEPCVLWLMTYGDASEITLRNATDAAGDSAAIPDDVFHCHDLSSRRNNSISCDPVTREWNLTQLSEARPPGICPRNFTIPLEEVSNVQDWFEPCVLWAMIYGNLRQSANSTDFNTTEWPTIQPFTNETVPVPTNDLPPPPPPTDESSNVVVVDPLRLTFVWPANTLLEQDLSIDQLELRMITEQHVLEALQAELGLTLVTAVNLILTSGLPTSNSVTETVTGTVSLNARIPSVTVQRLVQASFQKNALELYQFRLRISKDQALQLVKSVIVGTGIDMDMNPGASPSTDSDSQSMDTVMIAVISAVGAALVAVCCLGFCILFLSKRRSNKGGLSEPVTKPSQKASVAGSSKASRPRISAPAAQATIPPVPTKSMSNEEYPPIYEDDEEYQMSLISMSEMDEQSRIGGDDHSVTTSVYSYFNNDDMSLLGGASVASSFLYQGPSSTRNEDVNANKKKGVWNVLETMKHHFGSDSELEEEEKRRRTGILGSANDSDSHGSSSSGNLLYASKQPPKIEITSSADEDEVEDYESEMSLQGTPVRERLERMWREEDAKEVSSVNSNPNDVIIPPPKVKGLMVFQDDNSGNNSHSNSVGGSCATDESPVPSVLLEADNLGSAPSSEGNEVTRIVNRIPTGQEEDDFDDDDQKMALPLPTQLITVETNAADPNSDNASQSSRLSDRSNTSGRSNGSRRNPFGPNTSNAQSVRIKREKSWGKSSISSTSDSQSVTSVHSTDSAKYRSLLNQGDTNDAALFGLMTENTTIQEKKAVSPDSALKATRLSYEQDENKPNPSNSRGQLSTLIKSFDDVWAQEEKSGPQGEQVKNDQTAKDALDNSSDEEDIYLGGEDDDDNDGKSQSDNDSIKSGASRAVQGLSSLLTSQHGESALDDKKNSKQDTYGPFERKLSFEIQDSSSEEDESEEKKDELIRELDHSHMERMMKRDLGGCNDTMASF